MTDSRFALRLAALTVCGAFLASCGERASLTGPSSNGPWTGVWQGTLTDTGGSTGTLRLTLEDRALDARGSLVSGTWTTSFADASRNGAGTVGGTVTDGVDTLLLTPATAMACSQPIPGAAGSYALSRLTLNGRALQGAFAQLLCTNTITGALSLTKQ